MESCKGLFVRNLSYSTTDEQLKEFFSLYGETKACFIVKDSEGKSRGYGFVYYKSSEDAQKAKSSVKKFNGRPVLILFAKQRKEKKDTKNDSDDEEDYELQTSQTKEKVETTILEKHASRKQSYDIGRVVVIEGLVDTVTVRQIRVRCRKIGDVDSIEYPVPGRNKRTAFVSYVKHKDARVAVKKLNGKSVHGETIKAVLLSREDKTPSKTSLKKSRVIVRNLDFKCCEENLNKIFSPVGDVIEVYIPKKNGRSRGYAFVQFTSYFDALTAVKNFNGILIKDRKVAVDFVAPKTATRIEDKDSNASNSDSEEKQNEEKRKIESENSDENEGLEEMDKEQNDQLTSTFERRSDVKDGKTLFIRNVPHDADEEDLSQTMEQFGQVRYCRLVQGDITGVCRGTAFVQYRYESSVKECLEASCSDEGLYYNSSKLDVTLALSKDELGNLRKKQITSVGKEDKRNLYLLSEGVMLKGSDAANELPKAELAKRVKSYEDRKLKLKNPYFFISKTRLSVRNLPTKINEKKLKVLFKSHAGRNAVIKQVKLMRSKDKFTEEGLGRSLGFGFVEFTMHEPALRALRAINNNPSVFGTHKRPIVEFALEDSRAIKLMKERKKQLPRSNNAENGKTYSNSKVKWQLKCKARRLKRKEAAQLNSITKTKAKRKDIQTDHIRQTDTAKHIENTRATHRRIAYKPKQHNETDMKEKVKKKKPEKLFNDLVEKYRSKLILQDSRWFD